MQLQVLSDISANKFFFLSHLKPWAFFFLLNNTMPTHVSPSALSLSPCPYLSQAPFPFSSHSLEVIFLPSLSYEVALLNLSVVSVTACLNAGVFVSLLKLVTVACILALLHFQAEFCIL